MLKINILCIGKLKEKYLKDACFEYCKRLGAFCKLSVLELDEYKVQDNPSAAQINAVINNEGEKILSKISHSSYVIALCIEGNIISSEQLSLKMSELAVNGDSEITFVIGGSFGLSDGVKKRANFKLSMSKMTFPHQLARVILLEQVYRSFQIMNSSKYHK